MTDTPDPRLAKAYELGCDRGWAHASFVDAYGKEHDRRKPDYPSWMHEGDQPTLYGAPITSPERRAERAEFARGWTDGRRRCHRGQYPDGSKIPD